MLFYFLLPIQNGQFFPPIWKEGSSFINLLKHLNLRARKAQGTCFTFVFSFVSHLLRPEEPSARGGGRKWISSYTLHFPSPPGLLGYLLQEQVAACYIMVVPLWLRTSDPKFPVPYRKGRVDYKSWRMIPTKYLKARTRHFCWFKVEIKTTILLGVYFRRILSFKRYLQLKFHFIQ